MRSNRLFVAVLCGVSLLGCSSSESGAASTAESETAKKAVPTSQPAPAAAPVVIPDVAPPAGARVFFKAPIDGATIVGPVADGKVSIHVEMGAEGVTIREAGELVPGTGHHHILIDVASVALGTVVPKDDQHVHFGTGQTEAELPLTPGTHTLVLQLADGLHRSYGPALSAPIRVTVKSDGTTAAAAPAPAAGSDPHAGH